MHGHTDNNLIIIKQEAKVVRQKKKKKYNRIYATLTCQFVTYWDNTISIAAKQVH